MDHNFTQIRYCNSVGYLLENFAMANTLIHRLTKYYKLDLDRAFSKYFKLAGPNDLSDLQKDRHFIYPNVVAPLTLLFLTTYQGINFCFYISRGKNENVEIVSVKHRFHPSLFEGDTVFEGKMIADQTGTYHYLINDIVVHRRHTFSEDLRIRLQTINRILETEFIEDPILDVAKISLQEFVDFQYLESLVTDHIPGLPYRQHIDGLIFRSIADGGASNKVMLFGGTHCPLPSGDRGSPSPQRSHWTCQSIHTLPGDTTQSVCFKLKKTKLPDIYELYLTDSMGDIYLDIAGIPDLKTSRAVKKMFPNGYHYINAICKWDTNFSRWTPILRSSRKNPDTPNVFGVTCH